MRCRIGPLNQCSEFINAQIASGILNLMPAIKSMPKLNPPHQPLAFITRSRLWSLLTTGSPPTTQGIVVFVTSLMLGAAAFIRILGTAFFAKSAAPVLWLVALLGCGGAFVTGGICSALQPKQPLLWSIGHALPMLGWGAFSAVFAIFESVKLLSWAGAGCVMAAMAVLGALVGRWLVSRRK